MNPTEVSDDTAPMPAVADSGAPEIFVPRRGARRRAEPDPEPGPDRAPEPDQEPTSTPGEVLAGASAIEEMLRGREDPADRAPFSVPRLEMPWVDPLPRTPELTEELRDVFHQHDIVNSTGPFVSSPAWSGVVPPITEPVPLVTMPHLVDLPSGPVPASSVTTGGSVAFPGSATGQSSVAPPPSLPSMAPVMFSAGVPSPAPAQALLAHPPVMAAPAAPPAAPNPTPSVAPVPPPVALLVAAAPTPLVARVPAAAPIPTPVVAPLIPTPAVSNPVIPVVAAPAPSPSGSGAPVRAARQLKRRRRRRRVVMTVSWLVVLAGVVAGAVVAREVLLQPDWDADAKVFAEAVELSSGRSFAQPVALEQVAGPAFSARAYDILVGADATEQRTAAARAMGLLQGAFDSMTTAQIVNQDRVAVFDPVANTVVVAAGAADGPVRDAAIAAEMAVALAGQTEGWADGWSALPSAERVARRGMVDGNALLIGDGWSSASGRVNARQPGALPPVLIPVDNVSMGVPDDVLLSAMLGRTVGAWVVTAFDDQLVEEARRAAVMRNDGFLWDPAAAVDGRDIVSVVDAEMRGMGYWFLVLASRLDPEQAWRAAQSWSGDRQELVTRSGQTCVNSTISTRDDMGLFTMVSALNQWAAAAPPEAATTVEVTGTGDVIVRSCDPGAGAMTRNRTSGPAELVSYSIASWHVARSAQIAAAEAGAVDAAAAAGCAVTSATVQAVVDDLARALRAAPADYRAAALSDTVAAATVDDVVSACLASL